MNPNWQEIFIKEAAVELFTISFNRQPNYQSDFDVEMLKEMETRAKTLIPIIQNLFK